VRVIFKSKTLNNCAGIPIEYFLQNENGIDALFFVSPWNIGKTLEKYSGGAISGTKSINGPFKYF
jgi:hypothetical protein